MLIGSDCQTGQEVDFLGKRSDSLFIDTGAAGKPGSSIGPNRTLVLTSLDARARTMTFQPNRL
jgi:hypothetical protein